MNKKSAMYQNTRNPFNSWQQIWETERNQSYTTLEIKQFQLLFERKSWDDVTQRYWVLALCQILVVSLASPTWTLLRYIYLSSDKLI